jgi:CHAD domain-containing protein
MLRDGGGRASFTYPGQAARMAVTHRETERKYEASSTTALPSLAPLFGDAAPQVDDQLLVATYFDTQDLRLARSAITLRHRTGDAEAGWHLKVPAGPASRDEIRLPERPGANGSVDVGPPPAEFLELVGAYLGGQRLIPVAELRNHRTLSTWSTEAGRTQLEVTDDRVTARPLPDGASRSWREFEVELGTDADLDLLDRAEAMLTKAGIRRSSSPSKLAQALGSRLPKAPTPPGRNATAGEVVLAYLRTQAAAIRRNDLEIRRDTEDAVHQLRVAARRARSALQAFGAVLDRERTQHVIDELRWLGESAGQARDLEVLRERFAAQLAALPPEDALGPVQARVTHWFAPRQAAARANLFEALNSARYLAVLDALDSLLAHPPTHRAADRKAGPTLLAEVKRAQRRLDGHLKAAKPGADGRNNELHEARKAAKRVRYAAETVGTHVRGSAALVDSVKALQDLLGEHQDGVVAAPVCRDLAIAAHGAGENGYPFGLLAGLALGKGLDDAALAAAVVNVHKAMAKLK